MKTRLLLTCGEMPVEGSQPAVPADGAEKPDAAEQRGLTPASANPQPPQPDRPDAGDLALRISGRDQLIKVCDGLLESGADVIDIK